MAIFSHADRWQRRGKREGEKRRRKKEFGEEKKR